MQLEDEPELLGKVAHHGDVTDLLVSSKHTHTLSLFYFPCLCLVTGCALRLCSCSSVHCVLYFPLCSILSLQLHFQPLSVLCDSSDNAQSSQLCVLYIRCPYQFHLLRVKASRYLSNVTAGSPTCAFYVCSVADVFYFSLFITISVLSNVTFVYLHRHCSAPMFLFCSTCTRNFVFVNAPCIFSLHTYIFLASVIIPYKEYDVVQNICSLLANIRSAFVFLQAFAWRLKTYLFEVP